MTVTHRALSEGVEEVYSKVRKLEGLWEIVEPGGSRKGERRERIEALRGRSSKKWGVFSGLCLSLELVLVWQE